MIGTNFVIYPKKQLIFWICNLPKKINFLESFRKYFFIDDIGKFLNGSFQESFNTTFIKKKIYIYIYIYI